MGEWRLIAGKLDLQGRPPSAAGVYAFVLDETVMYVGVTQNGLQTRLDQYRRGHAGQRTNARINQLIRDALAAGQRVTVMTVVPPELDWNGLPVDGSAGLEAGLIRMVQPAWNVQGVT